MHFLQKPSITFYTLATSLCLCVASDRWQVPHTSPLSLETWGMVYAGSSQDNGLWPYSLLVVSIFRSLDSLPAPFLDGIQDSNKRIRNRNQIEIQPLESRASEIDFKGLASGHRPREARTEAVLIVSVKSEQLLREMHGTGRGPLRFIFSTPSVLEASITTHSWKL